MGKYFECFVGLYIILKIVPLILNIGLSFLFIKKNFRDGNFNDLYENWNKKPIMGISIEDSYEGEKIIFGKTPDNTDLFKWKGSSFKVKRGEYNYFDSFSKKKGQNFCGTDSNGNKLYFDECPINYIEFSPEKEPFLSREVYGIQTIALDAITYIHYSNKFINGKILIDFDISDYIGPCSDKKKNNICSFYSNCKQEKKCNSDEKIIDNSYVKLDYHPLILFEQLNEYNNEEKNNYDYMEEINLYGRTYIASNEVENYNRKVKIIENIKKMKNTAVKNYFVMYILPSTPLVSQLVFLFKQKVVNIVAEFISFLAIGGHFILIFLEEINPNNFKYIYHHTSEFYSKEYLFIYLKYSILFLDSYNIFNIFSLFSVERKRKNNLGFHNICKFYDKNENENENQNPNQNQNQNPNQNQNKNENENEDGIPEELIPAYNETVNWCRSESCCIWNKKENENDFDNDKYEDIIAYFLSSPHLKEKVKKYSNNWFNDDDMKKLIINKSNDMDGIIDKIITNILPSIDQ